MHYIRYTLSRSINPNQTMQSAHEDIPQLPGIQPHKTASSHEINKPYRSPGTSQLNARIHVKHRAAISGNLVTIDRNLLAGARYNLSAYPAPHNSLSLESARIATSDLSRACVHAQVPQNWPIARAYTCASAKFHKPPESEPARLTQFTCPHSIKYSAREHFLVRVYILYTRAPACSRLNLCKAHEGEGEAL